VIGRAAVQKAPTRPTAYSRLIAPPPHPPSERAVCGRRLRRQRRLVQPEACRPRPVMRASRHVGSPSSPPAHRPMTGASRRAAPLRSLRVVARSVSGQPRPASCHPSGNAAGTEKTPVRAPKTAGVDTPTPD